MKSTKFVSLWAKFRGIAKVDETGGSKTWTRSLNLAQWTENQAHEKYKQRIAENLKTAKPVEKQ